MRKRATKETVIDNPRETEIDYRPRQYSLKQQFLYAAKFVTVAGFLFWLIWLSEM